MFKFGRINFVIVTFRTGSRLLSSVEIVMAGGAGLNGLVVFAVVEKNIAGSTPEIESIRFNRFTPGHTADDGSRRRNTQGDC